MDHYYIYCLHNDDLPEYYVGHTMNWTRRWDKHKCESVKSRKHLKVYQYINSNGGIDNFKMELLYETYCNLEEAIKLERYYKNLLCATLNTQEPGRTCKEYNDWWQPIHREKNKEQINEKKKKKFTCICGSQYSKGNQQRHFRSEKHINFIRLNIGY